MQANNSKSNKIQNRQTILKLLVLKAPISRVELSALSGLSKMSLTNIVSEFIENGLVVENGVDNTAAGKRKPVLLDLARSGAVGVGIYLSNAYMEGCVADLKGKQHMTARKRLANGYFTETAMEFISDLLCAEDYPIYGIGISYDETVEESMVRALAREVEKQFRCFPVFVAPSVHALLLAEKYYGGEKGVADMICICDGEGLEMGVLTNHKILYGSRRNAGHIAHLIIQPDGLPCTCGKKGCLAAYASVNSTMRFAGVRNYEAVLAAENPAALERQCKYLSVAVLNFAQLYDPEAIILSGALALPPVTDRVQWAVAPFSNVRISASVLGEYAHSFGSAVLVFEQVFFS